MKKHTRKLISALLAFAMVISTMSPAAYAAPGAASKSVEATADTATGSRAETVLAAARALAKLNISTDAEKKAETPAKAAVKEAIFEEGNKTVDVSDESISADEMKTAKKAVLKENNMTGLVNVTYKTDGEGNVTSVKSDVDTQITTVIEELDSETYAAGLTDAQKEQIVAAYANYQQYFAANADYFGVQSPFFTTKDTNDSPIGSLLSIAGIPQAAIDAGQVSFDEVKGVVDLFTLANQFAVEMHGGDIIKAKDEAMKSINSGMSRIEKYLALNDWLAHWCTFDMAYIMEMPAPQPAENKDQTAIYNAMYEQIKAQIKQQILDQLMNEYAMSEAEATPVAEAQATSMMEDDDPLGDGSPNGKTQAMTLATSVIGLWEGNNVGALINKTAVCLGYSNAYNYLVQWAFPEIYKSNGKWKTWEELNNKDGKWNKDAGYIVDYTRITFDAEVTMYGEKQDKFDSDHYWNAVKTEDGKWYYVDPCYTDIYIECMIRERVETDGNMNHLYFMISDDTIRDLYDGYYKEINTLYKGIATDKTYEDAWFAFAKGNTYLKDGKYYYFYDSTDLIDQMNEYGGNGRSSKSKTTKADNNGGLGDVMGWEDAEYKLVYHDASKADSDASFETLVDFSTGQVYNPKGGEDGKGAMEDNDLIKTLYAEFQGYAEEYPSVMIGGALYGDNFYFSLGNCILSYNLTSGEVKRLIEYNTVYGDRDMSVALGGMAFNMTSNASDAELKVENNPIADMTIKPDGKMYVSIATNAGFISGKDPRNMKDTSDYGYRFEETNYNPGYSRYMQSSYGEEEVNDNDEFMWSANIKTTVDMSHLTGSSHNYNKVNVAESCTDDAFSENRCTTCGLINGTATASAKAETHNADVTAEENKAKLAINVTDSKTGDVVGSSVLEKEKVATSGEDYTFTKDEIQKEAESIVLSEGYTLDEYTYEDVTVKFNEVGNVNLTATTEVTEPTEPAESTVKVTVNFVEKAEGGDKTVSSKEIDVKGTTDTEAAAAIKEAAAKLEAPEGYTKTSEEVAVNPATVTFAEGATATATVVVEAEAPAESTVKVTVNFVEKAEGGDKTVSSKEIDVKGTTGKEAAAAIKEEAAKLEAPEGYTKTSEEVTVDPATVTFAEGATATATVVVEAEAPEQKEAKLTVALVDADNKALTDADGNAITAELPAQTGNAGEEATFAKANIVDAAKGKLPEGYALKDEASVEDVKVPYGESKTVNVVAVKQSVATLNIKVYDSAIEEITEDTETLGTGKLEQTGNAGETHTFVAADIEAAAKDIAIGDYTLDAFTYKDVKVEFGKSGEVVLKATKNLHGHGHTYIKFDETYYTKDDNDNWNKGTIYVCLDCKKALEADELEENMTDRDKKYDVSKLSGNKTKVWAWSLDYTAAALFKIPTELDDYLVDCVWDNPAFSSRTSATVEASGPEGKCDEGRVYTYTATAGSDKDVQKVTEITEHAYKTEWKWAEDYSEAELKITCANEGCGEEHTGKTTEIEKLVTEPQCEINGYTSYTAKITLDGREFADKQDANVVPATGHTWDDNDVCTVCGEHKPLAKVTLKTKDTTYTGKAISIEPARVQSIQYNDKNEVVEQKEVEDAKVTYTYYTTSSCETKTNKDNAGASKSGGAPVKTGAYYVKASVAETPQDYKAGESDVTKLVIRPRATNVTVENISSGVQIKWDKKSEASGYYVYRKAQTSTKFSRIATVGKDTTSYTDKTAKAGRKYDYTVRTYGQDKAAAATYDTKGNYIMRLTQPSYTVENVYSSVMLTWKKVTGAEKYGVYRKAATSKKFSKIGVVKSGSKLEFKDTTAKNGNRYTYTVKAYAGSYKSSAYKPGKTMIRLVRPDVSSLKNSSSRKLTAAWSKNSKAEGYKVQYCTKSSFSGAKTKTASSNKITISSLTKGKTYYVRVRSYKKYSGRVYYSAWSKSKKVKISR